MLERIRIKNFKSIKDIDLRITNLNVLAGLNGSGKSSFLQILGLLKQSYALSNSNVGLHLSGELVHLGYGRDILNEAANTDEDVISFEIREKGKNFYWHCISKVDSDFLEIKKRSKSLPRFLTSGGFQFLQADRITPQTLYPRSSRASPSGFLGAKGEFTPHYLAQYSDQSVSKRRLCPQEGIGLSKDLLEKVSPTEKLLDQVAGWLQQLSPGARLQSELVQGTDNVKLQYSYLGKKGDVRSSAYRPTNVGFGLTYVLPIIVAALAAESGDLLLLENPEAHLHPQGQAALGALLCKSAEDGVQIIVETHSDHVLNGIRLAVKNEVISSDHVALHFFSRPAELGEVFVESPAMQKNGLLSNWPSGFFDQWDKTVDALLS